MGKGKKKGGKEKPKDVESALQGLSISEDMPSTSQPVTSAPVVEEEGGLGLTGGGQRKPKKKQAESSETATVGSPMAAPSTVEQKTVTPAPETKPVAASGDAEPKVEEAVGLGLDLGSSRKKPQRKKKPAASTADDPVSLSAQPSPATVTTPYVTQPVLQPTSAPATSWGGGIGRGRGRGRSYAPETPASVPSQAQPGPSHASLPQGRSQWSRQEPPMSAAPSSKPVPPQPQPQQPQPRQPQPQQSQPQQSQPRQPQPRQQQPQQPTRTDSTVCRFTIPKIIRGNTVPARNIMVLCNYLEMKMKPMKIYRYDVSFKPDRPKKFIPKAFTLSKEAHFRNNVIAFDQMKNCYSITALKNVSSTDRYCTEVELTDNNGKPLKFEVSYKFTGMVDLNTILEYMRTGGTSLSPPTEAIQCIDVVLRQGTLESYIKAGRQFFQRPSQPIDLGDGLEMWTGLFQSAIFTSRPFINIDVAHKGFPRCQSLLDALKEFRLDPRRSLESQMAYSVENFRTFLRGLKVVAMIGGDSSQSGQRREFICNAVMRSSKDEMFSFEDPDTKQIRRMSVADYFTYIKKVRIQYPELNCVWVGPREKTIYYPMELLSVAYGQVQNKQLNERQLQTMVKEAATPPDQRKRKIEEVIRNMNYPRNEQFKKFGLEISDKFHQVNARVLTAPKLEVGGRQTITPMKGSWQANQVYRPEALQSWGFIAVEVDRNRCNCENVIDLVQNIGRRMGMNVSPPALVNLNVRMYPDGRSEHLKDVLINALRKEVKFLFIIVSSRGRDYYHKVKQIAECDVGILTQCILEKTASMRMNPQTMKNILLKVNSKLMGINQVLSNQNIPRCLSAGGVMVVGADVTHPSPDQSNIPSIAAVTASIDPKCFIYNIELSIQTPKKEMIVEFEDMMVDHLQLYRKHQNSLPKKIFVFRDGVSEGQFAQVLNSELQAVHNAYKRVCGPQAKPEVLFLLVQKRHHTRLFVPQSRDNVEPGTVVDTEIVHASELDFYLVSHQAIKGTARPTRYHAVCNDGAIPHDEVEQLTYYLCHLYSRCMRAVSYPTPTYYAHLACFRARSLTHGQKFNNEELERQPKRLRVMDRILELSRMFFV